MQTLNQQEITQVSGALSSAEVATAAALGGKTLVEGLVAGYTGGGLSSGLLTDTLINAAASFAGVYGGFQLYHLLAD